MICYNYISTDNINKEVPKQDQGTQTDVSMADFNLWYKFLHCKYCIIIAELYNTLD